MIDELYRELIDPDRPEISVVSYVALTYSRIPPAEFLEKLRNDLSDDHIAARVGLSMAPSVVVRRVRRDQAVREELENSLDSGLSPDCKISIPRILAMGNGVSNELAAWCREEIKRQLSGDSMPELGFDLFTGEVRSVVHGLLDVVDGRS
ncbi:MAG: hypothetical protein IH884_10830 [Myxococcales bacterium]|nr:hypothetical protein [Myxococcales bacterium]